MYKSSGVTRRLILAFLAASFLLLAQVGFAAAPAKSSAPASTKVQGENYVSLKTVAARSNLALRFDNKAQQAFMTSKWSDIVIPYTGRRISFNGIVIWLSFPIVTKSGTVYMAEKDISGALNPVLRPQIPTKPTKIKTIVISPGHGGKDPGNTVRPRLRAGKNSDQTGIQQEKKYTLLLSKTLQADLRKQGFIVHLVRDGDNYLHPEKHAEYANKMKADLFVSVHFNGATDSSAKGVEVFALTPVGCPPTNGGEPSKRSPGNRNDSLNVLLAYQVQKALVRNIDMTDRGLRRAGFLVLRNIYMPGILVEAGFMSNSTDLRKITLPEERRKMSNAIITGILAYKKLVERQ